MNKIHINIVLIADRVNNHDDATITSKTLEMVEDEYFNDIYNTLSSLTTKKIYHYINPKIFLDLYNCKIVSFALLSFACFILYLSIPQFNKLRGLFFVSKFAVGLTPSS